MDKDFDNATITITSSTESQESLEKNVFGQEPEPKEEPRGGEPAREPGAPRIIRNYETGEGDWKGVPVGLRKRIEKLTARAKSAEEALERVRGGGISSPESQNRGTETRSERTETETTVEAVPASEEVAEPLESVAKATGHEQRVQEAKGRYQDWDATMQQAGKDKLEIPEPAVRVMAGLENSADVQYLLAKRPDICGKLLNATPEEAVRAIHEISTALRMVTHPRQRDFVTQAAKTLGNDAQRLVAEAAKVQMPTPVVQAIHSALVESEDGAQVYAHLLRNPTLQKELAGMDARTAYARVLRIAGQLESGGSRPKPVSNAPRPTESERGNTRAFVRPVDEEDDDTYIRRRNEEEREKRRRGY